MIWTGKPAAAAASEKDFPPDIASRILAIAASARSRRRPSALRAPSRRAAIGRTSSIVKGRCALTLVSLRTKKASPDWITSLTGLLSVRRNADGARFLRSGAGAWKLSSPAGNVAPERSKSGLV